MSTEVRAMAPESATWFDELTKRYLASNGSMSVTPKVILEYTYTPHKTEVAIILIPYRHFQGENFTETLAMFETFLNTNGF